MKKLINFRPMLIIGVILALGICSACFFYLSRVFLGVFSLAIFLAITLYFVFYFFKLKQKKKAYIFISVSLLFFLIGAIGFSIRCKNYDKADLGTHYYDTKGTISKITEYDSGSLYILKNVEFNGIYKGKTAYKLSLYVSGEANFEIGDEIEFNSVIYDKKLSEDGTFFTYNAVNNIKYSASVSVENIQFIKSNRTIFQTVNIFIKNTLKSALSGDEFAISYAMLTGDSSEISNEALSSYRSAGVAHIFAVSGLHIGFVAFIVGFILKKLRAKNVVKLIIVSFVTFFYAGICGFSSSSVRAVIMSIVLYSARLQGDRYDPLSSVFFAWTLILTIFPMQLLSVGFQLSFGVVIGIIILAKPISKIFKFLPMKLRASLGTVMAAQLSAIPISLANFGEISIFAVIANLIFIQVVGFIFVFLLLATIFGGLLNIANIALFLPKYILLAVTYVIKAIDYKYFIIGGFSLGVFAIFYYLALLLPSGFINIKGTISVILSGVCLFVCVIGSTILSIGEYNSTKIYVLGSKSVCANIVSYKDFNMLVINNASYVISTGRLEKLSEKSGTDSLDCVVVLDTNNSFSLQVFTTRIKGVFDTENIYYYGEKREDVSLAKKSFPSTNFTAVKDYKQIEDDIGFRFLYDGKMLLVSSGKNDCVFCGDFSDTKITEKIDCDVAVCYNNIEKLKEKINAKYFISSRIESSVSNGESAGVYKKTLRA